MGYPVTGQLSFPARWTAQSLPGDRRTGSSHIGGLIDAKLFDVSVGSEEEICVVIKKTTTATLFF